MSKIRGLVGTGAALAFGVGLLGNAPAVAAGTAAASVRAAGPVPAVAAGTAAASVRAAGPVPAVAPAGAELTGVYLDSAGKVTPAADGIASASTAARLGCTPVSGRDNPHYSGGDVSGHGWWKKGSCHNDRAKVYNCLYEYYTDGSWRRKACSPKKTLKPGGGSSNRTVARAKCADRQLTSWRNHVDVDVIGEIDTAEKPYNQANVQCRVY